MPGIKNYKVGDRVRINWNDVKQFGATGVVEKVDDIANKYLIKLDDPTKCYWPLGHHQYGYARHSDKNLEAVVSEFKSGDRVKINWESTLFNSRSHILNGRRATVVSQYQNGNYKLELDAYEAAAWGEKHVTFAIESLTLVSEYDGFRDKLFAYLTSKDSLERKALLAEIGTGWWWSDEQLYNYVADRLNKNRDGWCKTGVDNAREALGVKQETKTTTFTLKVSHKGLPLSFVETTEKFINRNFGAVEDVLIEQNK